MFQMLALKLHLELSWLGNDLFSIKIIVNKI